VRFVEEVFRVQGPREKCLPKICGEIAPISIGRGRCLCIQGTNLKNVGVNLEEDDGFVIHGVLYSEEGTRVDVHLDVLDTVEPGLGHRVTLSSIYGEVSASFGVVADDATDTPLAPPSPETAVTTAQASE
jgi:hypothetical protein